MRHRRSPPKPVQKADNRQAAIAGERSTGPLSVIHEMHRTMGNRGVQRMLSNSIQRKTSGSNVIVQRMESQEEEELQMMPDPGRTLQRTAVQEEEEMQMKAGSDVRKSDRGNPTSFAGAYIQRKTGGTPMPEAVQRQMEQSFNSDFSDVRIHEGGNAPAVGALAYTQGNDIHFAPGKYQPDSESGKKLLGHELAHVVQQRKGRVKPTGSVRGIPLNDSPSLEREADELGAKAALSKAPSVTSVE